jgi:glycosyltransferase involved in cell wall biosynthesis
VLRPLVRFLWNDADAVVAVSNGLRQFAAQTTPDIPIQVIPNAIELGQFTPPPRRNGDARPKMLFVGRINAFKSVETLVAAAGQLRQAGVDDFELQLVGEGDRRVSVERMVVEQDLTRHVRFLGWVERDKLIDVYRQADIFVTATTWEGMPNTVLEGMACGLPVVATRASGLEELVRDGVNGYLVDINDTAAMAKKLAELLQNPHERQRMGKQSRKIAENEFAWEFIAEQYVDVYRQVTTAQP